MLSQTAGSPFSRPSNIPFCIYSTFSLPIRLPVGKRTRECRYLFVTVISVSELLGHIVVPFFWGNSILFSVAAAPVDSSTQFLHTPPALALFCLMTAILRGMRRCLTVVLICIYPVIRDTEHLFLCLLAICYSFFGDVSIQVMCPLKNFFYSDLGREIMDMTPTAQTNRRDSVKPKETIKRMKRQPTEWKQILKSRISDNKLISKVYKEILQLNSKQNTITWQEWSKDLNKTRLPLIRLLDF